MNKSQVLAEVKKFYPDDRYIFIGDRTMEGGNDYPLAKIMNEQENCSCVSSWCAFSRGWIQRHTKVFWKN